MCYWVGTKKIREEMSRRFKEGTRDEIVQLFYKAFIENNASDFKEYYVAIGKGKPVLTTLVKENGKLQFRNMVWTLPYSYFDKKSSKIVTRELLNSMCERVFFQHKEIIFKQRCIIPIDGYFEFYHFNGENYPYFINPSERGMFYAGGIWDGKVNQETGEVIESFSIITTPPNPLVSKIHNNPKAPNGPRMLLLINQEKALEYLNADLNTEGIKKFFVPYDEKEMKAHTVLKFLKKENTLQFIDSPKVQEYFNYPELAA